MKVRSYDFVLESAVPNSEGLLPTEEAIRILEREARDPLGRTFLRTIAFQGTSLSSGWDLRDHEILMRLIQALRDGLVRVIQRSGSVPPIPNPKADSGPSPIPVHRECRQGELIVRLDLNPRDVAHVEDRFLLLSSDGSYRCEKTPADDQDPSNDFLDLRYTGLNPDLSYSLRIRNSHASYFAFQDRPYAELSELSRASRKPTRRSEVSR